MAYPKPLHYWVQSVLPLVYDDSLSYYEVIAQCVDYINHLTVDTKAMQDRMDEIEELIKQADLDKLEEILERLDDIDAELLTQQTDIDNIETKNTQQDTEINNIKTKNNQQDTEISNIKTKNTQQDTEINTIKETFLGKLPGNKVSIIGDSISTFDATGYKIAGYSMYYPTGDVQDVEQCWWYKAIKAGNATLLKNASYSGSRVTATGSSGVAAHDFYARTGSSVIGTPDTVIVQLGTNDSANNVSLGSYDYTTDYTELSEAEFRPAYIKGIKSLQNNFPNCEIICLIIAMAEAYAKSVIYICNTLGVKCISIEPFTTGTAPHPNANGMKQIASNFNSGYNIGKIENNIDFSPFTPYTVTPATSEAFTCGNVIVQKWGHVCLVSVINLQVITRSTSFAIIAENMPKPSLVGGASTSPYYYFPSADSTANPVTPSSNVRLSITSAGALRFSHGEEGKTYTANFIYFCL